MLIKLKQNEGFASLVEVIVTSVVFMISVFGVMTAVSMLRPQADISTDKIQASYIGERVHSDILFNNRPDRWNDPAYGDVDGQPVSLDTITVTKTYSGSDANLSEGVYDVNYQYSSIPGFDPVTGPRKVDIVINYSDQNY